MNSVFAGSFLSKGDFAGPFTASARGTTPRLLLNFANQNFQNPAGYVRTNLLTYSTGFTSWSTTGVVTITNNAGSAPDGTNTADKVVVSATTNSSWAINRNTAAVTSGLVYTTSIYVKPSGYTRVQFTGAVFNGGAFGDTLFDLTNNTVVDGGTGVSFAFTNLSNGWIRIAGTWTASASGTPLIYIKFVPSSVTLVNQSYTPDGTSGGFFWGAQVELGASASTLIPTSGSPVSVTTYASSNPADVGNLTYTRAGTAYAPDKAGNLIAFAGGQIRITDLGYWAEEARTNSIPNSTANNGAVAGTPGTLPTGWYNDYNPNALSTQVVGTGTEGGVPYIDWRVFGTMAASSQINLSSTSPTSIVATQGQTWTATEYVRAVAGSTTNLSGISMSIADESAAGVYLNSSQRDYSSTTLFSYTQVTQNRLTYTRTLANALTARVLQSLILFSTPGGAVDITLRIAAPQMELGASASTYIPTTTAAVTRAADVGYYTIPSLSTAYSLAAVGTFGNINALQATMVQLDDSGLNRVDLQTTNGSAFAAALTLSAGVVQANLTLNTLVANTAFGYAISVQASRVFATDNGRPGLSTTSATLPANPLTRLVLGNGSNGIPLNGPLSKTAVWSSALSDPETIYRSAGNF